MKIKQLAIAAVMAMFLTAGALFSAEPEKLIAKPVAPAPAKPQDVSAKLDALLKFIPEVVVTSQGKSFLTRAQLLADLTPELKMALEQGMDIKEEMVKNAAYQIADISATKTLILTAAKAQGLKTDSAKAKETLDKMKQQVEAQGEGKFAEELKKLNMTEEALLSKIEEQDLLMQYQQKIVEKVAKPAAPTEAALKKFYDENAQYFKKPEQLSAAHILIAFPNQKPSAEEDAAALKKCQEVRAKLKADGSNFAEIAKTESACPSKEKGGDLGSFGKGQMVPEFEQALEKLKEGEISQPVKTMFGYHIIKAGARTAASTVAFEEAKAQIQQFLTAQGIEKANGEAVRNAIEKLRTDAKLEIKLPQPQPPKGLPPQGNAPAPVRE